MWAQTFWSFTQMSVLIAACVNLNVLPDAIVPDTEDDKDGKWLAINTKFADIWPNITVKGEPPADGEEFDGIEDKYKKFFDPAPGIGDD